MSELQHSKMLEKYLHISYAGNYDKKQMVEAIPRELTHWSANEGKEGKVVRVRELLQSEAIESTTLIQTEVYGTVLEGAEPAKVMRDVLPVVKAKSNKLDWVLGEAGTYAGKVAEGAEIPVDTQDYSKRTFTVEKYGVRPLITRELVEDGLFDVVTLELRKAGARIENALNQEALSVIIENAGLEHDTTGSNQGVKAIASAMGLVRGAHFNPDTIILHPEAEALILRDYVPGSYGNKWEASGQVRAILGLKSVVTGVTDNSSTYTWDYDSDGDIGMCVLDSKNAGAIVIRRDISVERYSDPIRDLIGIGVTARFDADRLHANASARVEY